MPPKQSKFGILPLNLLSVFKGSRPICGQFFFTNFCKTERIIGLRPPSSEKVHGYWWSNMNAYKNHNP